MVTTVQPIVLWNNWNVSGQTLARCTSETLKNAFSISRSQILDLSTPASPLRSTIPIWRTVCQPDNRVLDSTRTELCSAEIYWQRQVPAWMAQQYHCMSIDCASSGSHLFGIAHFTSCIHRVRSLPCKQTIPALVEIIRVSYALLSCARAKLWIYWHHHAALFCSRHMRPNAPDTYAIVPTPNATLQYICTIQHYIFWAEQRHDAANSLPTRKAQFPCRIALSWNREWIQIWFRRRLKQQQQPLAHDFDISCTSVHSAVSAGAAAADRCALLEYCATLRWEYGG